ncbi:MAG: ATP-binding protein, partial [Candidatus Ozemobacteraceae bacterium]
AMKIFRTKAARSGRMTEEVLRDSDATLFENLELIEGTYLKRAAALLFCDNPEKFVSGAFIKIGFFVTDDDLRYQDEIHGCLFEQVEKTLELLCFKYLKAYIRYEGIQRIEEYLFPEPALRETLLNAVIHKDYASGNPIQISVYEDKIIFWNSGQLPENWTLRKLQAKHPSNPYNPLLAKAFFRSGYIESWGRGIEKIKRECREHGIKPPKFDSGYSGLMVTFHANPLHIARAGSFTSVRTETNGDTTLKTTPKTGKNGDGLGDRLGDGLGDSPQSRILAHIKAKPTISITELSKLLGVSTTAIEKSLKRLKAKGLLKRVGQPKSGHWEILK